MSEFKILIIGLGPHCRRIYLRNLQRLHITPTLVIDLESKRNEIEEYVKLHCPSCCLFFIPDDERDASHLTPRIQRELDFKIAKLNITHAIISTEPKAHYAYLQYCITRNIPTLTDKPITAPINACNDEAQAIKIQTEYHHLLSLVRQYKTRVVVQCQRRYDLRYLWVIEELKKIIKQYSIPVSHIQISHCDGSLNLPDEFFTRENHPYKYGYGKLFHSGYHFIDLLTLLLSYDELPTEKKPTDCFISSINYGPHDQLFSLDESFYLQMFKHVGYAQAYDRWRSGECRTMGELDVLALFEFSNNSHTVTTCSLNLLQSGFTRRSWPNLPTDTYKGNGRVRHETVNLQLGPLLNIQIHSYQAYEVKEKNNPLIDHSAPGGLEHFDIHIYRNSEIIGGPPYELISGRNLFNNIESDKKFIGYNEHARDECLKDFLFGNSEKSTLLGQKLTIDLVTNTYLSMCRKRNGQAPISKFELTEKQPLIIEEEIYDTAQLYSSIHCRS